MNEDIMSGEKWPQSMSGGEKFYVEKYDDGRVFLVCAAVLTPDEVKDLLDSIGLANIA